MAFKLNDSDHGILDKHLDATLEAYKQGRISLSQARSSLAQLITAGVIDNEGEFRAYMNLDPDKIFTEGRP